MGFCPNHGRPDAKHGGYDEHGGFPEILSILWDVEIRRIHRLSFSSRFFLSASSSGMLSYDPSFFQRRISAVKRSLYLWELCELCALCDSAVVKQVRSS